MLTTLDILTALAEGKLNAAQAACELARVGELAAREAQALEKERVAKIRRVEAAEAGRLAIAARGLASSAVRPRPTTPIIADRQVVSAFRLNEVSKAQTSAMNCYVIELA